MTSVNPVELVTTSDKVDLVDLVATVDRGDQLDLVATALCQEAGARGSRRDKSRRLQETCRDKQLYREQLRTTGDFEDST